MNYFLDGLKAPFDKESKTPTEQVVISYGIVLGVALLLKG